MGADGDAWRARVPVLSGACARSGRAADGAAAGAPTERPAVVGMAALFDIAHASRLSLLAHIER